MKVVKAIGDLLTALSVVALLFAIVALAIGVRKISETVAFLVVIGSLFVLLIGIIVRSIGKSASKKDKD